MNRGQVFSFQFHNSINIQNIIPLRSLRDYILGLKILLYWKLTVDINDLYEIAIRPLKKEV